MGKNQVQIVVGGFPYTIKADAEREKLIAAVDRVNKSINANQGDNKRDELRATALSAVILAYKLIEQEETSEVALRDCDTAVSAASKLSTELHETQEKQVGAVEEAALFRERFDTSESKQKALSKKVEQLEKELQDQCESNILLQMEYESAIEEHDKLTQIERDNFGTVVAERDKLKSELSANEEAQKQFAVEQDKKLLSECESRDFTILELSESLEKQSLSFSEEKELLALEQEEKQLAWSKQLKADCESRDLRINELDNIIIELETNSIEEREFLQLQLEENKASFEEQSLNERNSFNTRFDELNEKFKKREIDFNDERELLKLELEECREFTEKIEAEHEIRLKEEQNLRSNAENALQEQHEEKGLAEQAMIEILKKISVSEIILK